MTPDEIRASINTIIEQARVDATALLLSVAGTPEQEPQPEPEPPFTPWEAEVSVANATLSPGWKISGATDAYGYPASRAMYADKNGLTCKWIFTIPESGEYEIFAWMSQKKPDGTLYKREKAARYAIDSTFTMGPVDQNASGWVKIDPVALPAGSVTITLTSTASTDGLCCVADAMKIVRIA